MFKLSKEEQEIFEKQYGGESCETCEMNNGLVCMVDGKDINECSLCGDYEIRFGIYQSL